MEDDGCCDCDGGEVGAEKREAVVEGELMERRRCPRSEGRPEVTATATPGASAGCGKEWPMGNSQIAYAMLPASIIDVPADTRRHLRDIPSPQNHIPPTPPPPLRQRRWPPERR